MGRVVGAVSSMKFQDLLAALDPDLKGSDCKVHFATTSDFGSPLEEFKAGTFDSWQALQTRRNFERPHVLSFIQLPTKHRWLFAGAFDQSGGIFAEDGTPHTYFLARRPRCEDLAGRLVVTFQKTTRQAYLYGETCLDALLVHELTPERASLDPFPGFKRVKLPFRSLCALVDHRAESWRAALGGVSGVYLVSDTATGKLYVGSATGADRGIWGRWCEYTDGHGQNDALKRLVAEEGIQCANDLLFSVLEIGDLDALASDVRQRESHWKEILLSRSFGLNRN